jgi:hypothetical protein
MRAILSLLTLTLAVLGIDANDAHNAAAVDYLALHANFLDACPYLHFQLLVP